MIIGTPLAAQDRTPPQAAAGVQSVTVERALREGNIVMMAAMNDNLNSMRAQLDRIRDAREPEERERLIRDHRRLMTWQLEMMKRTMDSQMWRDTVQRANRDQTAEPSS
jgi:hypothetical protein